MVKDLVLRGGVEEAAFQHVKDSLYESNRNTLVVFSSISSVAFLVLMIIAFLIDSLQIFLYIYIIGFALSLTVLLIAEFLGKKKKMVLTADVYLYSLMLMGVGVALGTILSPTEIAATFIAFLLVVPQVFVDRPVRMYGLIVVSTGVFIFLTMFFKDASTRSSDITNAIVFGLVSIALCTHIMSNRIKKFSLEYEIRNLAENDQLTGLKNRYCYQQYLEKTNVSASRMIYCVYIDVNGLHEMNNMQGHEAGDRMLQFVASVIQNQFGKEHSYRIGGDEFIALGIDRELSEIMNSVENTKTAVELAGYHIAAGVSIGQIDGIEVKAIISEAEQKMYEDKIEYYRKTDKNRRRV